MARAEGALTCGCSVAGLPLTRPDSALLVSLLPSLVHVRGIERLSVLVRLVGEEASEGGQAASSCSRASWKCCSSRRCG